MKQAKMATNQEEKKALGAFDKRPQENQVKEPVKEQTAKPSAEEKKAAKEAAKAAKEAAKQEKKAAKEAAKPKKDDKEATGAQWQILDLSDPKIATKGKSRRGFHLTPLAPGRSTHFFSRPEGAFDTKVLKSDFGKIFASFKSGKFQPHQVEARFVRDLDEQYISEEEFIELSAVEEQQPVDDFFIEEEVAEEAQEEDISADLKNLFIGHIETCTADLNIGSFSQFAALSENFDLLYADPQLLFSVDEVKEKWTKLISHMGALVRLLNIDTATSYIMLEGEDTEIAVVNCPDKKLLPFLCAKQRTSSLFNSDKPASFIDLQQARFFITELSDPDIGDLIASYQSQAPKITLGGEKPSVEAKAEEAPPVEAKTEEEDSSKKILQALVPEMNFSEQTTVIIQDTNNGEVFASSGEISVSSDYINETASALFSVGGLCFEMLGSNFEFDYLLLEAEDGTVVWGNNTTNGLLLVSSTQNSSWKK